MAVPGAARRSRIVRVFWEGSGVVTAIVASVSTLVGLALVCYAAYKLQAKSFKLGVSVFKILTVTIEVESRPEEPTRPASGRPKATTNRAAPG
jgi:hypothetical protein